MITNENLLRTGGWGTVITGVCCFTPVLAVLFGVVGLSAWVGGWLDYILFPLLAIFIAITIYAVVRYTLARRASRQGADRPA